MSEQTFSIGVKLQTLYYNVYPLFLLYGAPIIRNQDMFFYASPEQWLSILDSFCELISLLYPIFEESKNITDKMINDNPYILPTAETLKFLLSKTYAKNMKNVMESLFGKMQTRGGGKNTEFNFGDFIMSKQVGGNGNNDNKSEGQSTIAPGNPQQQVTVNPQQQDTVNPQQQVTVNPQQQDTVNPQQQVTVNPQQQDTVNPQQQVTGNQHVALIRNPQVALIQNPTRVLASQVAANGNVEQVETYLSNTVTVLANATETEKKLYYIEASRQGGPLSADVVSVKLLEIRKQIESDIKKIKQLSKNQIKNINTEANNSFFSNTEISPQMKNIAQIAINATKYINESSNNMFTPLREQKGLISKQIGDFFLNAVIAILSIGTGYYTYNYYVDQARDAEAARLAAIELGKQQALTLQQAAEAAAAEAAAEAAKLAQAEALKRQAERAGTILGYFATAAEKAGEFVSSSARAGVSKVGEIASTAWQGTTSTISSAASSARDTIMDAALERSGIRTTVNTMIGTIIAILITVAVLVAVNKVLGVGLATVVYKRDINTIEQEVRKKYIQVRILLIENLLNEYEGVINNYFNQLEGFFQGVNNVNAARALMESGGYEGILHKIDSMFRNAANKQTYKSLINNLPSAKKLEVREGLLALKSNTNQLIQIAIQRHMDLFKVGNASYQAVTSAISGTASIFSGGFPGITSVIPNFLGAAQQTQASNAATGARPLMLHNQVTNYRTSERLLTNNIADTGIFGQSGQSPLYALTNATQGSSARGYNGLPWEQPPGSGHTRQQRKLTIGGKIYDVVDGHCVRSENNEGSGQVKGGFTYRRRNKRKSKLRSKTLKKSKSKRRN